MELEAGDTVCGWEMAANINREKREASAWITKRRRGRRRESREVDERDGDKGVVCACSSPKGVNEDVGGEREVH